MDRPAFQLLSALRAGAHLETALAYEGQSPSIFGLWLLLGGPRTTGRFLPFARALRRAVTEAEVRSIALISKAAEKEWRAGAWLLEHKFPERWGRVAEVGRRCRSGVRMPDSA